MKLTVTHAYLFMSALAVALVVALFLGATGAAWAFFGLVLLAAFVSAQHRALAEAELLDAEVEDELDAMKSLLHDLRQDFGALKAEQDKHHNRLTTVENRTRPVGRPFP